MVTSLDTAEKFHATRIPSVAKLLGYEQPATWSRNEEELLTERSHRNALDGIFNDGRIREEEWM